MAERYAELLDDVAAKVARMARCGLPPMDEAQARDFGRRVADMLAEDWAVPVCISRRTSRPVSAGGTRFCTGSSPGRTCRSLRKSTA